MNEAEFRELLEEHPEFARFFHFVSRPCKDGPGYWRRIPKTYRNRRARPIGQLRSQLVFSETGHKSYGSRGFDEKGVPIVASKIGERMRGKHFKVSKWKQVVEELRESLKEVAVVVEEKARV